MNRLLCLLLLAGAISMPSHADGVVRQATTTVQGAGPYQGAMHSANSGQLTVYNQNGVSTNPLTRPIGPVNAPTPGCVYNYNVVPNYVVPAGVYVPNNYQNYVVVSPGTTTYTSSSYSSGYVVAQPTQVYVAPPPATASPPAAAATGAMPVVTVDKEGYVHSPFSNSVFKVSNLTNGQTVFDPSTGQAFRVQTATPPAPKVD